MEDLQVPSQNALEEELRDFASSILSAGSPRVPGTQGETAVTVAQQVLESIASHRWEGTAEGMVGPMAARPPRVLRSPAWPAESDDSLTDRRRAG